VPTSLSIGDGTSNMKVTVKVCSGQPCQFKCSLHVNIFQLSNDDHSLLGVISASPNDVRRKAIDDAQTAFRSGVWSKSIGPRFLHLVSDLAEIETMQTGRTLRKMINEGAAGSSTGMAVSYSIVSDLTRGLDDNQPVDSLYYAALFMHYAVWLLSRVYW
jgi:hypothetical protein